MEKHVINVSCLSIAINYKSYLQGKLLIKNLPSRQPRRIINFIRRVLIGEAPQLTLRIGFYSSLAPNISTQSSLTDYVYSNFLSIKRNSFLQKSLGESGITAGIDVHSLISKINELALITDYPLETFHKKFIRLSVRGPGQVKSAHVHFPQGIKSISPNIILGEISDPSILDIYLVLEVLNSSISTWNPYNIAYITKWSGRNRSKGNQSLKITGLGKNLSESFVFPFDQRKFYYKGINFLHFSKESELYFLDCQNTDLPNQLQISIVKFKKILLKLKFKNKKFSPLLIQRKKFLLS